MNKANGAMLPLPGWQEELEYRIKPKEAEKGDFICEIDGVKWWLGPESEEEMSWGDAKEVGRTARLFPSSTKLLLMLHSTKDTKQFKECWYW